MTKIISIAASMLSVSPLNVRKTQDEAANAQMRASIVASGIVQNLVGVPVPRKKGRYEITAGGRRLTQVHAAIALGELPADFAVPVLVMTDKEDAQEASLVENFQRLGMGAADECIAFQHLMTRGHATIADVAKRFGVTERFVAGRLRLASLAEPVFTALRDGKITLDFAMAYASTSDTERQAVVFEQMGDTSGYGCNATTIRRMMTDGGYRGTHPKALLVGSEAYQAAGGRIARDLFSDAAEETWLDRELLDTLAAARLGEIAETTKTTNGYGEVRILESQRDIWTATRDLDTLEGETPGVSDADATRITEIEVQLEAMEADDESEGMTDEDAELFETLEAERNRLEAPATVLSDEQKAGAIAFVFLDSDGKCYLHHEAYAAPAPIDETGTGEDGDGASGDSGAVARPVAEAPEKSGITQRLADELAYQKTELVALHVASDPHFALILGTFMMVDAGWQRRNARYNYYTSQLPSTLRAEAPQSRLPDFKSCTQAADGWTKLEEALDDSWTTAETAIERFDAFTQMDEDVRAAWLGWTIARTLEPVPHGQAGARFTDHIGATLGIDSAAWWRPTAANYFDRVSKTMVLGAFTEVGGTELAARYGASKKADLAAAAEKLFAGDTIVEAETKTAALAWVPPSMAFSLAAVAGDDETATDDDGALSDGDDAVAEDDTSSQDEAPSEDDGLIVGLDVADDDGMCVAA